MEIEEIINHIKVLIECTKELNEQYINCTDDWSREIENGEDAIQAIIKLGEHNYNGEKNKATPMTYDKFGWISCTDVNPVHYDEYFVIIDGSKDIARYYPKRNEWTTLDKPEGSPLAKNIFRRRIYPDYWLNIPPLPKKTIMNQTILFDKK